MSRIAFAVWQALRYARWVGPTRKAPGGIAMSQDSNNKVLLLAVAVMLLLAMLLGGGFLYYTVMRTQAERAEAEMLEAEAMEAEAQRRNADVEAFRQAEAKRQADAEEQRRAEEKRLAAIEEQRRAEADDRNRIAAAGDVLGPCLAPDLSLDWEFSESRKKIDAQGNRKVTTIRKKLIELRAFRVRGVFFDFQGKRIVFFATMEFGPGPPPQILEMARERDLKAEELEAQGCNVVRMWATQVPR
jgi:hypothetical protein